ncbi:MAG: plastocyanin/azurin family copper-binding protein [Candidatus Paceibacterota bacterium]|jgi:plastocyanin
MTFIILGKPLLFWFGLLAIVSLIFQFYLGYKITHGRSDWFKYHKLNAGILGLLVGVHVLFGLSLYLFPPAPSSLVPQGTASVSIGSYAFDPETITIKRGESVVWINNDPISHQISGGSMSSPLFGKGETYTYAFDTAGTFEYTCNIHPFMKGTVVVK